MRKTRNCLFIQRLTILLLILFAAPANAWWDCDWKYRFTADIAKPPGRPLFDYQVRMDLNSGNVPASLDWSRQGDDLRVIDGDDLTELTFFIEQWDDAGQTAIVWVLVPSIPGGGRTVYLYYDGPAGVPSASTPVTFTIPGFQFHTRNTAANPTNRASAEAAFANAPASTNGYGCAIIPSYTNVNNRSVFGPPNRTEDIGLSAESFFEVTPAEAGVWEFRYGADFGRGGGLYVNEVALDEKWNADLWWAYDWNNTSEILQGSINLAPGFHSIRILGFVGCCDGGLTVEFKRPGGTFQAMSLTNIDMSSRECVATREPVVTYGPAEVGSCPDVSVTVTNQTLSDPVNGTSFPKAIFGAIVANAINVLNSGTTAVDSNSLVLRQTVDPGSALRVTDFDGATSGPVQFVDGAPISGLSYTFTVLGDTVGDDVDFSQDNGGNWDYVPVAGTDGSDPLVTDIRISPQGTLNGNSGLGDPAADFIFKTVMQ
jgi:hypothetical protein